MESLSSNSKWEDVEYYLTGTRLIRLRGGLRQLVFENSDYIAIGNISEKESHEEPLVQGDDIFADLEEKSIWPSLWVFQLPVRL